MTQASVAIQRPSMVLALTDWPRSLVERGTLPFARTMLARAPRGDGHPVMVLPGFLTSDASTRHLRRYLASLGHDVHGWALGHNLGPRAIGADGDKLVARVAALHRATGRKVSLVGWSLGGVMARQVARRLPDRVRQLVSLGAPFTGDVAATIMRPLYERVTGQKLTDPDVVAQLLESRAAPPVPATSIYSRTDGVVAWRNCLEPEAPTTENIEVRGSHCGLAVNPVVLFTVADRLAQPEGQWRRFKPSLRPSWYPLVDNRAAR